MSRSKKKKRRSVWKIQVSSDALAETSLCEGILLILMVLPQTSRLESQPGAGQYYYIQLRECSGGPHIPGGMYVHYHHSGRCSVDNTAGFTAWPHIAAHGHHTCRWSLSQPLPHQAAEMSPPMM